MRIYNTRTIDLYTPTGMPYTGMWYTDGKDYFQYPDLRPGTRLKLFTAQGLRNAIIRDRAKIISSSVAPVVAKIQPTEEDYTAGKFVRFFVQKRNAPLFSITEVDSRTYNETLNTQRKVGINNALYNSTGMQWHISGPREYVATVNSKTALNMESIFPGISSYLADPLQFYRPGVERL